MAEPKVTLDRLRVLLVEDQPYMRQIIRQTLERLGVQNVYEAEAAEEPAGEDEEAPAAEADDAPEAEAAEAPEAEAEEAPEAEAEEAPEAEADAGEAQDEEEKSE